MNRKPMWLPLGRLSIFFVVVVTCFYFFLQAFNPHIDPNPAEWEPKKLDSKKTFFLRLIEKQIKTPKK